MIKRLFYTLLTIGFLASSLALGQSEAEANAEAPLWEALNSPNHFAIIRHALAPGTGDPSDFAIDDCSTQRNLSAKGRDQAMEIGNRFRENGITNASVYTSQWCRCRDTADLLAIGEVNDLELLNSFFTEFQKREPQTQALRDWIATQKLDQPLILISHQVNITSLTGIYPSSGEIVVVRMGENSTLEIIGTI